MNIKNDLLYTVTEAAEITKIPRRSVGRYAHKIKAKRIDNTYVLTGQDIKDLIQLRQQRENIKDKKENKNTVAQPHQANLSQPYQATSSHNKTSNEENSFSSQLKKLEHSNKTVEQLAEENAQRIKDQEDELRKAIALVNKAAAEQEIIYRTFNHEEYREVIASLERVDLQEEQIKYLRGRIEKQEEEIKFLRKTIEQRNYIEAKNLQKDD